MNCEKQTRTIHKWCITFLAMTCIFMLSSCDLGEKEEIEEGSDMDYTINLGEVVSFYLDKAAFQKFLDAPALYYLAKESEEIIVYNTVFRDTAYDNMNQLIENVWLVNYKVLTDDPVTEREVLSGIMRIGSLPIYTEFIDFMSDASNFEKILSEQGIDEKILSYVIIGFFPYEAKKDEPIPPGTYSEMCVWIHTDEGDYFLENVPQWYEDIHNTKFNYELYDLNEYSKKYAKK